MAFAHGHKEIDHASADHFVFVGLHQ